MAAPQPPEHQTPLYGTPAGNIIRYALADTGDNWDAMDDIAVMRRYGELLRMNNGLDYFKCAERIINSCEEKE